MSDNGNETGSNYEVGKGKPPLHTRFTSENQPENRGRKPGQVSPKEELKKLLNTMLKGEINPLTELPEDMPAGRKVALNLLIKAIADGDLNAIKQVFENVDGKPAQAINLGGQDGENPVQIDSKLTIELVRPKESADG